MADTFQKRTQILKDRIGGGSAEMRITVDQVYARYQHERLDLKHPRGGQAKFLAVPLWTNHQRYLQRVANYLYRPNGIDQAFIMNIKDWHRKSVRVTPRELGDLRRSQSLRVRNGKRVPFKQPPAVPRLTEAQLRVKYTIREFYNLSGRGR